MTKGRHKKGMAAKKRETFELTWIILRTATTQISQPNHAYVCVCVCQWRLLICQPDSSLSHVLHLCRTTSELTFWFVPVGKARVASDINKYSTLFNYGSHNDRSVRNHFVLTIRTYKNVHLIVSVIVGPHCLLTITQCILSCWRQEQLNEYGSDSRQTQWDRRCFIRAVKIMQLNQT